MHRPGRHQNLQNTPNILQVQANKQAEGQTAQRKQRQKKEDPAMKDEKKEVKKEVLTDEQVEKATGGSSFTCPSCRKAIVYYSTRPSTCPYCGKALPFRPLR